MSEGGAWGLFWQLTMAVSAATFGGITLLVAFRGGLELLDLFRSHRHRR